ncbi:MAG: MBL fold metallo-hydrolase [Planctomycetota bacterium]|nr:MAG: MBL fold metallo-hydrolase [Planctomycetota bacterium]
MRIELLGTGGFHPNERRETACLVVPEIGLVLDAGTAVYRLPPRVLGQPLDLFLTHAHLDHICGLPTLLLPLLRREIPACRVFAIDKVLQAVREHLFHDDVFPVMPSFEFCSLEPGRQYPLAASSGLRAELSHLPLKSHPGGSRAYRVDWTIDGQSRSFAYVTDTVVDGTYTEFIRGVNLLIHECYFPDEMAEWGPKTGHSCTSQVALLAREAQVGQLILTHIDPTRADDDPLGLSVAREIFPATQMAEDQMVIDVL